MGPSGPRPQGRTVAAPSQLPARLQEHPALISGLCVSHLVAEGVVGGSWDEAGEDRQGSAGKPGSGLPADLTCHCVACTKPSFCLVNREMVEQDGLQFLPP